MFNLKNTLGLSDDGYRDLGRGVAACVLSNLAMLPPFAVLLQVIATLLEPVMSGNPLNTDKLWVLLGAGVACAVLYFAAFQNEYAKTYTVAYSEAEKIRLEIAELLRKLPLSFFNNKDLSELTTNMMDDCTTLEHTMSHVTPGLFANVITVTITCALLAVYDWRMSLALFAALPVAFAMIFLSRAVQEKLGERHVKAKLEVAEQVQEYLEGIKVVKAFGMSGEKSEALTRALQSMRGEAMRFEGMTGIFVTLAVMILQVGIGLVTFVGVNLLTGGSLGTMKLLAFLVIAAKIYAPLILLLTLLPELFYMLVSMRRMRKLRGVTPMTGDEDALLTNYTVEMKNVTFAYNDEDVIRGMSLTIPQSGVTAFVGPSGSGKTTVSRLIARFWDLRSANGSDAGEILIGGKNIREIEPERLMGYMGFVFQDVVLFNDTVRNNIRIGKQGATDEEVYAAAKKARCDEFIREMPKGYETLIGENGSTLSGGERQRISIARALLKNAPIVLLDEATASLDPENETQIQAAISELVKGRTVIVIAHRLRTVMGADQIAVLDKGRLVEQGTSGELIAKDGLFARLYRVQQESLGWTAGKKV